VIPAPKQTPEAPFAIRTDLGWSLVGVVKDEDNCSYTNAISHHSVTYCFFLHIKAKEVISPVEVARLVDRDFCDGDGDKALSIQDRRFLDLLSTETKHIDGKYRMPLPFKAANPEMLNNRNMCERRSRQLHERLMRSQTLSTV
jgi:hypothetical protein